MDKDQASEIVVTKNESGQIVAVTRQDEDGRILKVLAESSQQEAIAAALEAQRKEIEFEAWEYRERIVPDLRAALQACVEALEMAVAFKEGGTQIARAAITLAQEALK